MKHLFYFLIFLFLLPAAAAALDIDAVLCNKVEDRMPVNEGDKFGSDVERVYLWTKVTGAETDTFIRHVWLHEGKEIADVKLPVKGSPWRTYSYKSMIPEWTGAWEVKVVGENGDVILSKTFTIVDKMKKKEAETAQMTTDSQKKSIQASPNASGGMTEKATPADSTKPKGTTPR